MTQEQIARALNEWMRRYTETPEEFEREFQSVAEFLKEQAAGTEPSYGAECAAYIVKIVGEIG